MATTSLLARPHSPAKLPNRRLSRSSAPKTVPINSESSSSSSSSTPNRVFQRSSQTPTDPIKRERKSVTLSPSKTNGRLAHAALTSPLAEGEVNGGGDKEMSTSSNPGYESEYKFVSSFISRAEGKPNIQSSNVRTRSKTNSTSPVKRAQALTSSKRKQPEAESENEIDNAAEENGSTSEMSVDDEGASIEDKATGLGLNGMGVGEGDVPVPKPRVEAEAAQEVATSALADRKGAPRRKRKGDVEPETPAVTEARKGRHQLIELALLDLQKQEEMIRAEKHPLVEQLYVELSARREVKDKQNDMRFDAFKKEAVHVRDQNVMTAHCQWHTACLDLKEATVRSNIRRVHAAKRERTSWQFARLPEYLQVGRIPFDAGAGWRFDPGPLLSDPNPSFISFVDDDNLIAKRRRVEKGIHGLGAEARRKDLEKMGIIRTRPHALKRDPLEGPGPLPLARHTQPQAQPQVNPSSRTYDRNPNPYGYAVPSQPQQRINQLPAEYQTAPAPEYRDNRPNMPWWQPSTFPSSTPQTAPLPPPTSSQTHHHHHKHHHHHHHAPRPNPPPQPYLYTSQAPPPLPPPSQRPPYYENGNGENIAKTNAFYRNLLAS